MVAKEGCEDSKGGPDLQHASLAADECGAQQSSWLLLLLPTLMP